MKKNALILGLGFLGTNIAEELHDEYNIIAFSHDVNDWQKTYQGDFTKKDDLETVFKKYTINLVIHALSTTIPSNNEISYDIRSNLLGTIQLLDLMKDYSVPKIVFLSSGGTVYGRISDDRPVSENHATNPICSYGITKLAIEKYIALYQYLYHIDYVILRISNPYGENHFSDKHGFINVSLKKILRHEKITVWGDGEVVRDYLYVQDVAKILHMLLKKNVTQKILNIGSGEGHSINSVLAVMRKQIGDFRVEYTSSRSFDVPKIVLDTYKLQSLISYQLTTIEEGINRTYRWLQKNTHER